MDRLQPNRFYIGVLLFFIAAMTAGSLFFILGMDDKSYLVSDGVNLSLRYMDRPGYQAHLQGFIYAGVFLVAGGLLVLVIVLPNGAHYGGAQYSGPAPQPRRRATPDAGAGFPAGLEPAPELAAPQAPPTAEAPHTEFHAGGGQVSAVTIEANAAADEQGPAAPRSRSGGRPGVSLDEELLATPQPNLPQLDEPEDREGDGDADVVYGTGPVSEDSAWEFVQAFPDSAVKFLYRKTLDNKTLTPVDEDIYRRWEMRGLSRASVREIVLELMGWQSLPDDFPHNIWREVRDRIYEMQTAK